MKKFLKVIFVMIFVLMFSITVNADMDAPSVRPYEAIYSNVEGMTYTEHKYDTATHSHIETEKRLEYGDVVTVSYEYINQDNITAGCYVGENSMLIEIPLSDLQLIENEDEYMKEINFEETIEFQIVSKDGVEMYKGPAEIYEKNGTIIPYGEKVVGYYLNGFGPWIYTEYNGIKGWYCELKGVSISESKDVESIIAPKDIELYESMYREGEKIIIPSNTIFTEVYSTDPWSQSFYLNYNGFSGYVDSRSMGFELTDVKVKVLSEGVNIHESGNLESKVLFENIPVGTILDIKYSDDIGDWGRITFNGKTGWIDLSTNLTEYYDDQEETNEFEDSNIQEETNEFEDSNIQEETNEFEDSNIQEETNENEEVSKNNTKNLVENNIVNTDIVEEIDNSEVNTYNNANELEGLKLVVYIMFLAIVICATSFVTILLVNRKNKSTEKNEEKEDKE